MPKFIKMIFWNTYQVEYTTTDRQLNYILFFRGFSWEVVQLAVKEAGEKTKKENKQWTVLNIKKIS